MRILFLSHYFPPEGNAPASRTFANCRRWVEAGHEVTVVTGVPNVPDGVVYDGYRNRLFQAERMAGIRVWRVWTYLAPNKGTVRRTLNYLSYMVCAGLAGLFGERPDVVVATSPQFFCGWAGVFAAWCRRVPFVLEIRDIWPESIAAVGALKGRGLLGLLAWLERKLYAAADHIVTVGDGYKARLVERGVAPDRISVVMNGVDRELFGPRSGDPGMRQALGLEGKFVCAYVGTVGMACGLDVVLAAAATGCGMDGEETTAVDATPGRCGTFELKTTEKVATGGGEESLQKISKGAKREGREESLQKGAKEAGGREVAFLIVGDGAERGRLEAEAKRRGLANVIFTGRVAKERVADYLAISDCCLVHLRKMELFTSVMPSKIFDAAGMAKPIVNGVAGFAAEFVSKAGCGLNIEPENSDALIAAIRELACDPAGAERMGRSGLEYVGHHFDRGRLAGQYLDLLRSVAG